MNLPRCLLVFVGERSLLPLALFTFFLLVPALAATGGPTDPNNPAATAAPGTLLTDIEYGNVGGTSLRLDACIPDGAGPFPVAIIVHGGGWSGGDKQKDITPLFGPLTQGGFTWFSINYRLAPRHRWPACFEDVQAALRWVKTSASAYKGDPQRLALIGYSAGGNLAVLAVVLASPDTGVQAVVGLAPVTDHEQDLPQRGGLSPSLQDLHNRPKEVTPESLALLRATSPINHVKPGLPPFLLIQGDADRSVPYQQSLNFQQKLHACGVPCDIIRLPGAPHAIQTWEMIDPHYAHKMVEWLQRTLRADGGACPPSVVKAGAP